MHTSAHIHTHPHAHTHTHRWDHPREYVDDDGCKIMNTTNRCGFWMNNGSTHYIHALTDGVGTSKNKPPLMYINVRKSEFSGFKKLDDMAQEGTSKIQTHTHTHAHSYACVHIYTTTNPGVMEMELLLGVLKHDRRIKSSNAVSIAAGNFYKVGNEVGYCVGAMKHDTTGNHKFNFGREMKAIVIKLTDDHPVMHGTVIGCRRKEILSQYKQLALLPVSALGTTILPIEKVINEHFGGSLKALGKWILEVAMKQLQHFMNNPVLCDQTIYRGYNKTKRFRGMPLLYISNFMNS